MLHTATQWSPAALALRLGLALIVALWGSLAAAHGMVLRLQPTPDGVQGTVAYADGTPAAGGLVELRHAADDAARAETASTVPAGPKAATDAAGQFRLPLPAAGTWRVVARDDAGHRSEALITWAPPAGAVSATGLAVAGNDGATAAGATLAGASASAGPEAAAVAAAVAAALRTELAPLRDDIARLEARLRLADLVGGVALIIGAAGGWAWWRARRAARGASRGS